jgi:bacterioferritin-associated ferredoxin
MAAEEINELVAVQARCGGCGAAVNWSKGDPDDPRNRDKKFDPAKLLDGWTVKELQKGKGTVDLCPACAAKAA